LAIQQLQDEHIALRRGGLYWVIVDITTDAAVLARQFLAALPEQEHASLVGLGSDPQDVIASMADESGPATLRLLSAQGAAAHIAFKTLTRDLHRARVPAGSYVVLMLPSASLETLATASLQRWCESTRQWLLQRDATLLILCCGQAPHLHDTLLTLNESTSGLAQLYRRDSGICYQLNFWHSELGVCASQAFELELASSGFALGQSWAASNLPLRVDDQRIYLTQRAALEGAAPLSDQWRLFERREDLLKQAARARAATVIVALESNKDVESLGRDLHELREQCGVQLKVVVRETEPCLRYRDERLLLACGANLIVPFKTQLAHFLSLVDSTQGQTWRYRQTPDIQVLFDRLRPPPQRGMLAPREFITLLEEVYHGASGELTHQLLRLRPRGDLNLEQYMNQISLRRFGDVACVLDGMFYLFLFACRGDGLEPALGNICRLPWRDIFSECKPLATVDVLPRQDFLAVAELADLPRMAAEQVIHDLDAAISPDGYRPRRLTLPLSELCP